MGKPPTSLSGMKAQFGANLRRERRRVGLSQKELSARAGLHRTEIGLLERGLRSPRLLTMVKLASVLGIRPGALVKGIVPPPPKFGGPQPRAIDRSGARLSVLKNPPPLPGSTPKGTEPPGEGD